KDPIGKWLFEASAGGLSSNPDNFRDFFVSGPAIGPQWDAGHYRHDGFSVGPQGEIVPNLTTVSETDPGFFSVNYAFVAVVSPVNENPNVTLPACGGAPVADFDLSPSQPNEGDVVQFIDRSFTADAAAWNWDFGDGTTSAGR